MRGKTMTSRKNVEILDVVRLVARTAGAWDGALGKDAARLENEADDGSAVLDLNTGRPEGGRGVAVESDETEVVEPLLDVDGGTLERDCWAPRIVEGTTVFVEVVDREDDEEEDEGAGEYDLKGNAASDGVNEATRFN
ncbi:hypothetical protein LshimejAT787_0903270 [Lyophyllum shimeji]|uniref:Uncharacterized protein n=1 Tax=Lyophyllum shimeji TaxID=47721 RepID=A0A9P3UQB5_LYOSH|nr:hypothetical protein LshimejAT787_0903270 [Lyophyllum shimeji]